MHFGCGVYLGDRGGAPAWPFNVQLSGEGVGCRDRFRQAGMSSTILCNRDRYLRTMRFIRPNEGGGQIGTGTYG